MVGTRTSRRATAKKQGTKVRAAKKRVVDAVEAYVDTQRDINLGQKGFNAFTATGKAAVKRGQQARKSAQGPKKQPRKAGSQRLPK